MLEQLLASAPAGEAPDHYGKGGATARLEARVAELLGKPAAVFMPSGTMAQQIALRIWCDRAGAPTIAFHPTSHLHIHEQLGYAELHHLTARLLGEADRPIVLDDLDWPTGEVAAALIELPQRELGGLLPTWDELRAQVARIRSLGARVHLDGARLWESLPGLGHTAAEVSGLFDSVYVSFYKGLDGIAGAALAGDEDFIAEAHIWQRRHGGNLIALWPYALSALNALDERLERIPLYVEQMRQVAKSAAGSDLIAFNPSPPPTNMAVCSFSGDKDRLVEAALALSAETGVWLFADLRPAADGLQPRFEFTAGEATLDFTPAEVVGMLEDVVRRARSS